jgi:ADP-ribose pyrophosphatase YjhB (NUDIX family)
MTDAPDPDWLVWARRIQAIAQTGLAFDPNQYDRDRYETLRSIAIDMMASRGGADPARLALMFGNETGYATPKTDVRGAAFREGKILLVREAADHGRWALPGGWADVGLTPSENVVKELFEETGFVVRARKLAAVWDRTRQGHTPQPFHAYKCFFICDIMSGIARPSAETTEVAFFAEDAIPDDLSLDRVQPRQIARMFAHAAQPDLPTDFE